MTDGVTVDIIWIKGTRMPWFDIRLGHLKKKKYTSYICSIYVISYIYTVYILYISYKCRVKSVCHINRTPFTTYIG